MTNRNARTKNKGRAKARPKGTFQRRRVSPNYFGGCVACGLGAGGVTGLVPGTPPGRVVAPAGRLADGAAGTPDCAL